MKFEKSERPLEFEIFDQHISRSWYQLLEKALDWGGIKENNRFSNFLKESRQKNFEEINQVITKLNEVWDEGASHVSPEDSDLRERLNDLHKLFEIYRGPVDQPTTFFKEASPEIQKLVERLNVLIHQLEDEGASPRLVVTFEHNLRRDFKPEHYDLFTTKIEPGVVYINYCVTGRELLEAFRNRDTVVGQDNLRPLTCYAADFMIYFPKDCIELLKDSDKEDFHQFLQERGFKVGDKKNSIGRIPIARLVTEMSREEILQEAQNSLRVEKVYI